MRQLIKYHFFYRITPIWAVLLNNLNLMDIGWHKFNALKIWEVFFKINSILRK